MCCQEGNMSTSSFLRSCDVSALMRLNNELHELAPNPVSRNEHMLSTLCRMTGARVGVSAMIDFAPMPRRTELRFVTYVGLQSPTSLEVANRYLRTLNPPDPVWRPLLKILRTRRQRPTTRLCHQLVADKDWYGSSHYDE